MLLGKTSLYSQADPVNRNKSRRFNIHVWSECEKFRDLTACLFEMIGGNTLVGKSNRQPVTAYEDQLGTLILDLFVAACEDPSQSIMVSRDKNYYAVRSRYNGRSLSDKLILILDMLARHELIDVSPGYYDRSGCGESYITRIKPTEKLLNLFRIYQWDNAFIDCDSNRESIILNSKKTPDVPDDDDGMDEQVTSMRKKKKRRPVPIEYADTEDTIRMRGQLNAYNDILRKNTIGIPERSFIEWTVKKGEHQGQIRRKSLTKKFVTRVFSRGSWEMNGRFYGGFWQTIPREYRPLIQINGNPTVEIDFKGLHINMLSLEVNNPIEGDPYELDSPILPRVSLDDQRDFVKSLSLYAINAKTKESAFKAFRSNMKGRDGAPRKNADLHKILDAFLAKHPHLEQFMCTDQGIRLMHKDSKISEMVISHFISKGIPILCLHDSYIVEEQHEDELEMLMNQVMEQTYGKTIEITKKKRHQ